MSSTEEEVLGKAEAIIEHIGAGGTLRGLLDIGDEELEAIYAVAYNHFTAHKFDKAIELFKFLCLYDHTEPRWFYSLGITQQQSGDYEGALNSYGVATILDVDDPRPQAQAGYCLMAMDRWKEAKDAFDGAMIACGDDPAHAGVKGQCESMLSVVEKKIKPE